MLTPCNTSQQMAMLATIGIDVEVSVFAAEKEEKK